MYLNLQHSDGRVEHFLIEDLNMTDSEAIAILVSPCTDRQYSKNPVFFEV
jgi:hypothetical protein